MRAHRQIRALARPLDFGSDWAQNIRFGAARVNCLSDQISEHIGGSSATAVTSHCHAEQPMFQNTSNPNAESGGLA
jgi:hypothetical protein